MFELLLHNLRAQGIKVGISEWITFLKGLDRGLVTHLDDLYGFARTVLCTSEAQFDGYDLAFTATFEGVEIPPNLSDTLLDWLRKEVDEEGKKPGGSEKKYRAELSSQHSRNQYFRNRKCFFEDQKKIK